MGLEAYVGGSLEHVDSHCSVVLEELVRLLAKE